MPKDDFDYSLKIYCLAMSSLSEIAKIQGDALMRIALCNTSFDGSLQAKEIAEKALTKTFKIGKKAEETIKQN